MTRQRLGQHFLRDAGWREKIARAIRVSPHGMQGSAAAEDYCWIEIGAGHGEMTEQLLKSGAPVIAVELDESLVASLRRLTQIHDNLTVIHGDVLEADLAGLAAGRRIRIYGNLPYYITSPILHRFFEFAGQIDEAHVVIQLEVAARLTARPSTKQYGYLSVATQFYSRPDFALRLPPTAFRPPPEVASALVTLKFPGEAAKLEEDEAQKFLEFVKTSFAQKRKTLSNNLKTLEAPARVRQVLAELKVREDARAEQLNVTQFMALYEAICSER
ncbi:MAG: 16S rRNA (adenine(1518)-N(6)/adenine(1519)-N(6))-dimethyltransferase RsmA [Candidatus Acidiferrum sp.]